MEKRLVPSALYPRSHADGRSGRLPRGKFYPVARWKRPKCGWPNPPALELHPRPGCSSKKEQRMSNTVACQIEERNHARTICCCPSGAGPTSDTAAETKGLAQGS